MMYVYALNMMVQYIQEIQHSGNAYKHAKLGF